MNARNSYGFVALFAATALGARSVLATPIFDYTAGETTASAPSAPLPPNTAAIDAAPGATVTVELYIEESLAVGDTSLIASENGLSGAGVSVTQTASTGPGSPAIITAMTTDSGFNSSLDLTSVNSDGTLGTIDEDTTANGSGPEGDCGAPGALVGYVPLGTATITAGDAAGEVTTFTVDKLNDLGGNTITATNFYDLDMTDNGGAPPPAYVGAQATTFTITVTPEPATVGSIGMALLALAGARGRRQ